MILHLGPVHRGQHGRAKNLPVKHLNVGSGNGSKGPVSFHKNLFTCFVSIKIIIMIMIYIFSFVNFILLAISWLNHD